jgi:hypothetical protein
MDIFSRNSSLTDGDLAAFLDHIHAPPKRLEPWRERAYELQVLIGAYQQQIEAFEALIPTADASAAGRGYKARYWRKKANEYRQNLVVARVNLGMAEKELDALLPYFGAALDRAARDIAESKDTDI